MGALLSRPLIINHADCAFELPTLSFDVLGKAPNRPPSPVVQITLQCDLIRQLSKKYGTVGLVLSEQETLKYRDFIVAWMDTFPAPFRTVDPDRSYDADHGWVRLHRAQLQSMAYTMLMHPLKPYLTRKTSDEPPSATARQLRAAAVDCAIALMDALCTFFKALYPINTKFHFVLFGVFDAAAVLCSAVKHDTASSPGLGVADAVGGGDEPLPRRIEVLAAIAVGLDILRKIHRVTSSGAVPYSILARIAGRLPLGEADRAMLGLDAAPMATAHKRPRVGVPTPPVPSSSSEPRPIVQLPPPPVLVYAASPPTAPSGLSRTGSSTGIAVAAPVHEPLPLADVPVLDEAVFHDGGLSFDPMPDQPMDQSAFAELNSLVDWESLGLGPQFQTHDFWDPTLP